jgi:diaminopimelate decarboxylase
MDSLRFLTPEQALMIRERFGTPVYVYDERTLRANAESCLRFPNAYGLTVRYAIKACPNAAILQVFDRLGLQFDASSGYECRRAMLAGIDAQKLSLSSQEFPEDFESLHKAGISFNACSLNQIDRFGELFPGGEIGLRFNPGRGSGGTSHTNTGGPSSSFGIWHEWIDDVFQRIEKYRLKVRRVHTHIGSGGDPSVWQAVAEVSLDLVRKFPDVDVLDLGGGYKVDRMTDRETTDLVEIGRPVRDAFVSLYDETSRKVRLEIEPGTYLVANAGSIVATIMDVVSTGEEGYTFLKLDSGMTEALRPALYGAQHPVVVLPLEATGRTIHAVVVGHCCESGDLVTPAPNEPGVLHPRELAEAQIGDLCVLEGAGAYCAAMPAKNYNSFPEAPEVLLLEEGGVALIRERQALEQVVANELPA